MSDLCVCRVYEDMFTEGYKYVESLKKHDAKVREDAIEEFVEKADAEIYKDFNRTDVGEYTIADVALTIRRVAEQLKEKKNG